MNFRYVLLKEIEKIYIKEKKYIKMKILIFGVSCVGKSTVGNLLSKKINYKFYDLDEETVKYCNMSIDMFIEFYDSRIERDSIREEILSNIIENESNMVVAVPPILYNDYINDVIEQEDIIALELQDSVDNIFSRLIFTDENGKTLTDSEKYKNKHKNHYLNEIKEDIEFYKPSFTKINNKLYIDGKSANEVADQIIKKYLNIK